MEDNENRVIKANGASLSLSNLDITTSESLKEVRTNLLYGEETVIAFTSVTPGEGKTTMTLQLAKEVAKLDKKIVVIECDLKRPSMHKAFAIRRPEGLSNYFVDGKKDIVNQTAEGFDVIFAGTKTMNSTEMISSKKFTSFLDALKEKYDYVFIDTPPVTGSIDAQVLAKMADGVVFVTKSRHTKSEALKRALLNFREAKINIVGAILNRVGSKDEGYYYYYEEK